MLPPGLQTPREVTHYYDALYGSLIASGQAQPFLYPWAGLAAFVVIGYLLIDHRHSRFLQWLRYPVFAFLAAFQGWCITTNKAKHPAAGFGIGLLSGWGVLWVAAIMIARDCQSEFVRLERGEGSHSKATNSSTANGDATIAKRVDAQTPVRRTGEGPAPPGMYWQSYPDRFIQRLDFVCDVFCNFRGVGWNWQSSGVPPIPETTTTNNTGSTTRSRTAIRRFSSISALLKSTLLSSAVGYLIIDAVKTIMHNDAYFWGYMDAAPPSYLPAMIRLSAHLTRAYRLLVSLAGIYFVLRQIFMLGPIFFCGILGPRYVGLRGEAIMNPADFFGSVSCIANDGLAGWWGGFWHQTFRFAFEAPATRLLDACGIEKRSKKGKLVSLCVAFFLSGCLHACGSCTQLGDTRPLLGPMRFFLLQPVGIISQMLLTSELQRTGLLEVLPKWAKQAVNLVVVHVWLYYTAPLLVDDFARGGVWIFEPLPISPLRGLGLGARDDDWWCWWNGLLFWRTGQHWWDTGIAF